MSIQFPANPPLNHTFDYDGKTYIWDGEKWTASAIGSFDEAYVNISGDTMTGDLTVPSLNGGPLAGFRNQIINGSFDVIQRGGGSKTGEGFSGADRWWSSSSAATLEVRSMTAAQQRSVPWKNYIRVSSTGVGILNQIIELPGAGIPGPFVKDSVWTLSWYTQQDLTNVAVSAQFCSDRTGAGDVTNTVTTPVVVETGVTGPFNRVSAQITITGDIAATHTGLRIFIAGTSSKTFDVANVQLESSSVATPFEHRPIGTELALCQRYYQKLYKSVVQLYAHSTSGRDFIFPQQTVSMRPNVTFSGSPGNIILNSNYSDTNNVRQYGTSPATTDSAGTVYIKANYAPAASIGTPDAMAAWSTDVEFNADAEL